MLGEVRDKLPTRISAGTNKQGSLHIRTALAALVAFLFKLASPPDMYTEQVNCTCHEDHNTLATRPRRVYLFASLGLLSSNTLSKVSGKQELQHPSPNRVFCRRLPRVSESETPIEIKRH